MAIVEYSFNDERGHANKMYDIAMKREGERA